MQEVPDERRLANQFLIVELAQMPFDGMSLYQHDDNQQEGGQQGEE